MTKIKQSLTSLQKHGSPAKAPTAEKGKRPKAKDKMTTMDPFVQAEIVKLNQLVANLELMQTEAANSYDALISQTAGLNDTIKSKFEDFRSVPVKTKYFSSAEKAQVRQALTNFELSEDEE